MLIHKKKIRISVKMNKIYSQMVFLSTSYNEIYIVRRMVQIQLIHEIPSGDDALGT